MRVFAATEGHRVRYQGDRHAPQPEPTPEQPARQAPQDPHPGPIATPRDPDQAPRKEEAAQSPSPGSRPKSKSRNKEIVF